MFLLIISAVIIVGIALKIVCVLTTGKCTTPESMLGKTALITGGNAGIGFETCLELARRGCRVLIADKDDSEKTINKIIKITGNENVKGIKFDLASFKSVRALAKNINETEDRLDVLIHNAGTGGLGHFATEDGLHIGMQVNYFGAFLLTHLLLDLLKKSAPSRIVFVSSYAAYLSFLSAKYLNPSSKMPQNFLTEAMIYNNSKLCVVMAANELSRKLKKYNITVNSLQPGIVHTDIYNKYINGSSSGQIDRYFLLCCYNFVLRPLSKTPEQGAQTSIYLAVSERVEGVTGKYFGDCVSFPMPILARNTKFCEKIWKLSENLTQLKDDQKIV